MTVVPRKPTPGYSLAERNPEIVCRWDPTANDEMTPKDVGAGSAYGAW